MREVIKLGFILLLITSVAAVVLGVTNDATGPIIEQREQEEKERALKTLIPDASEFIAVDCSLLIDKEDIVEAYEGIKDGVVVGYAVKVNPSGYSGDINIIVGFASEGKTTGIIIGTHTETPGLGSRIKEDAFVQQFTDKKTEDMLVSVKGIVGQDNEIQAISGATVSSDAVIDGVNAAILLLSEILMNHSSGCSCCG
ncbi:MAG: RnfABCDGE type electron transport complex subunit G [Clostridiales bacterium]|nr:RnfABCDGE type electron transport complex subunit G [Clostridiales bacterium]